MDNHLQWLLAGLGLCLLAGWLGYRAIKSAEARRRARRAIAEATTRAEAQRVAAEELAHSQVKQRAAAQKAARAELARLAQAEAVRAEAARSAEEAARATAASLAAAEAARAHAARLLAEQAAQAEAMRLAAEQDARERLARRAANEERARDDARAATQETSRLRDRPQAATPASAQPATTIAAKTPEQTVVMVADDSKVVRVKTGRLLAQHRYQVSYANDGMDAVHQLQASLPDIVITDVEMPGMDGFELTRHVRQNPLTAHIPVIMITAANDKHREDASAAGVSVLLGKPYPEEELIAHIRRAMSRVRTESSGLSENVPGSTRGGLDAPV
jgi:CheY-like chemotaxis protein